MKGWEDGMYPPHASFPAGYSFGDNNVFGKHSKFGAGDTFGDKNVFGKGSVFGAGTTIGDDNNFAKDQTFGPGLRMGNRETIGARSTFSEGSMIGDENQVCATQHLLSVPLLLPLAASQTDCTHYTLSLALAVSLLLLRSLFLLPFLPLSLTRFVALSNARAGGAEGDIWAARFHRHEEPVWV